MSDVWISRAAGVAFVGGLINLLCDMLFSPGAGPGSALGSPMAVANTLAGTPLERLAWATVLGALAISTWTLATPALVRLVLPAGRGIAATVGLLNILAIGGCVAFHVATGCLGWVGRLPHPIEPSLLEPFWHLLQACLGGIFVALALALAWAAWKSREVPRWLPLASPLVSMSVLAISAASIPAPFGLTMALSGSTAGATLWLLLLWRSSLSCALTS